MAKKKKLSAGAGPSRPFRPPTKQQPAPPAAPVEGKGNETEEAVRARAEVDAAARAAAKAGAQAEAEAAENVDPEVECMTHLHNAEAARLVCPARPRA